MKLLFCVSSPEVTCFNLCSLTLVPSWEESLCCCGAWIYRRRRGESGSSWGGSARTETRRINPKRCIQDTFQWTDRLEGKVAGLHRGGRQELLWSVPPRMYRRGEEVFWSDPPPRKWEADVNEGEGKWFEKRNDIQSYFTLCLKEDWSITAQFYFVKIPDNQSFMRLTSKLFLPFF